MVNALGRGACLFATRKKLGASHQLCEGILTRRSGRAFFRNFV